MYTAFVFLFFDIEKQHKNARNLLKIDKTKKMEVKK